MPRLMDENMQAGVAGGFGFSSTRIEKLGATEYTLVTIVIDWTGSVHPFAKQLREALILAVNGCRKSPRSENLLIRVLVFSSALPGGIMELHGFKLLKDIDANDYPEFTPGGMTPLFDAAYAATTGTIAYAQQLIDSDFGVNGIEYYLTDGDDNVSSATPAMIAQVKRNAIAKEALESLVTILVAINAKQYEAKLKKFQKNAEIDQYVDVQDATEGRLAKLAGFISTSTDSQAQAMGSGGPSKDITSATF